MQKKQSADEALYLLRGSSRAEPCKEFQEHMLILPDVPEFLNGTTQNFPDIIFLDAIYLEG